MTCLRPIKTSAGEFACGNCEACLTKKANEWAFRLFNELQVSKNCYFVTLTYDELNVPRADLKEYYSTKLPKKEHIRLYGDLPVKCIHPNEMVFSVEDVQKFIKRLRKVFPKGFRYFLASEYGPNETERPHYHALFFNVPRYYDNEDCQLMMLERIINEKWNKGKVDVRSAINERVIYCAKYSLSQLSKPFWFPKPFILASRCPGIGSNYLNSQSKDFHKKTLSILGVTPDGQKFPLSRYYKNKIFDDDDRLDMRLAFLDSRIPATENEKEVYKRIIRNRLMKKKRLKRLNNG